MSTRARLWLGMFLALAASTPPLAAALFDYAPPLQNAEVTPAGSSVTYRIFDPARGIFIGTNEIISGSVFNAQNSQGVVSWNSQTLVYGRVYDPDLGVWVGTNLATGATADLRSAGGVIAWSSGTTVQMAVYDASVRQWKAALVATSPAFNLQTANGVVTWIGGTIIYYYAYNPVTRAWVGASANTGGGNDLITTDGLVAWSSGTTVLARTYDPTRAGWMNLDGLGAGNTFDLKAGNGVVAWSHLAVVFFFAYDPQRGAWRGSSVNSGQTFNLNIDNGSVFWNAASVNYTRGYDTASGNWTANRTTPYPAFGASVLQGDAPLPVWFFDMSLGGSTWAWNFGDGGGSTRRAPYHVFRLFQTNNVTLTISGPAGGNPSTSAPILSDVTAPAGLVLINNGDALTTNRTVTLALAATDNSGAVTSMRFSNDNLTYSPWEAFGPSKSWLLAGPNGSKTVFAQFADVAGNISVPATDTILLDTTPVPTAAFEPASLSIAENGGVAALEVVLSNPFMREVAIDFATVQDTATAGSDFTAVSGHLVFPPGQTRQPVSVPILLDALVELSESFSIVLSNPTNAIAGPAAAVTILDNNLPALEFSAAAYSVWETNPAATITVRLNAASSKTVSVHYAATNGTATLGQDYQGAEGTLVFAPGQLTRTFDVPILEDTFDELNETVALRLSNPTNALAGAVSTATLTIQDNDPPAVNFLSPTFQAVEGGEAAAITVVLSKPFFNEVRVDFATANGTALAGGDYISASGTLFYSPGQTSKVFQVTILINTTPEPVKTVNLNLSGHVNGTPGPRTHAVLYIVDDDVPRLTSPRFNASGNFQATVMGPAGQRLIMEVSSNLASWAELSRLTNDTGTVDFTDKSASSFIRRHYRARLQEP